MGISKISKPPGKEILRGNTWLTSAAVESYGKRGNKDLHQNIKALGKRKRVVKIHNPVSA